VRVGNIAITEDIVMECYDEFHTYTLGNFKDGKVCWSIKSSVLRPSEVGSYGTHDQKLFQNLRVRKVIRLHWERVFPVV